MVLWYLEERLFEQVIRHDPDLTEITVPHDKYGFSLYTTEEKKRKEERAIVRVVDALKQNPYVQTIDVYYARRTPELIQELAALFRVNSVIQRIGFLRGLTNAEFSLIAAGLHDNVSVKVLEALGCDMIGQEGGEILLELLSHNQSIEEIILSSGDDTHPSLGAEGAARIAMALRNERCALKKLSLDTCNLGDNGARDLANALLHNNLLEELDITRNRITMIGFRHVVEMLVTNSSLQVLILGSNSLNTAGDLLERALRHNTSLKTLDLAICGLSAADASRLFETLGGTNQTLARLDIRGNHMNEDAMVDFANFLPDMKGIVNIEFSMYEGITVTTLRVLLRGFMDNTSLLSIPAHYELYLKGDGEAEMWNTWSQFIARRNRMQPFLAGSIETAVVRQAGNPPPRLPVVPRGLWPHLVEWCGSQNVSGDAKSSLMYYVLRARANDVLGMARIPGKQKRLSS